MKIPNLPLRLTPPVVSLARIVSEDSQLEGDVCHIYFKSSKDS